MEEPGGTGERRPTCACMDTTLLNRSRPVGAEDRHLRGGGGTCLVDLVLGRWSQEVTCVARS